MPPKLWDVISSRVRESFPIFNLRIDRARSPRTHLDYDFYVLETTDWVNVIPLTQDKEVLLIRQYRHGIRDITLEIPGGILEAHDSPESAAKRELREETGYQESEMVLLGEVLPNPAFLNNRCYTYLAEDVFPASDLEQDDKEDIEVVVMPIGDIPRLIREGAITHSLVLAAFYRYYMEYLPSQKLFEPGKG